MPYVGKDLSMVVLLPKKVDGLADFEKALTADKLAQWLEQSARDGSRTSTLPKFKTTVEFELSKTLSELGMPLAFTAPGRLLRHGRRQRFAEHLQRDSQGVRGRERRRHRSGGRDGRRHGSRSAVQITPCSGPIIRSCS